MFLSITLDNVSSFKTLENQEFYYLLWITDYIKNILLTGVWGHLWGQWGQNKKHPKTGA